MLRFAAILACLAAAPIPAISQGQTDEVEEGLNLLSEGARRLLEELTEELTPLLRQLELQLEELQSYEAPEILPNGDIIIRRKPDPDPAPDDPSPDDSAPEAAPSEPIEL